MYMLAQQLSFYLNACLSYLHYSFSLCIEARGFHCGWARPVSSRSAKQPGSRSPPIVAIVTIVQIQPPTHIPNPKLINFYAGVLHLCMETSGLKVVEL